MNQNLAEAMERIKSQRILVLGDMIADIYLDGRISRISREAPVLVLKQAGEKIVAGGAANVVNNIAALGGQVFAAGLLGADHSAEGLREILSQSGAETQGLLSDEHRPTISKTRIIAGGRATVSQQIVRIDHESEEPMTADVERELMRYIEGLLPGMRGVVLSDYGSGTITPHLRESVLAACRERHIVSIVDSRYDIRSFSGVDYVKQNDAELAIAVKRELATEAELYRAGWELLEAMDAKGILVTRGEKGMVLFEATGAAHEIPVSDKSEVYDVSGAGDTCVATFILAVAAGLLPVDAAALSNVAAGIAVRKLGTATVSCAELRHALTHKTGVGHAYRGKTY